MRPYRTLTRIIFASCCKQNFKILHQEQKYVCHVQQTSGFASSKKYVFKNNLFHFSLLYLNYQYLFFVILKRARSYETLYYFDLNYMNDQFPFSLLSLVVSQNLLANLSLVTNYYSIVSRHYTSQVIDHQYLISNHLSHVYCLLVTSQLVTIFQSNVTGLWSLVTCHLSVITRFQ